IDTRLLDNGWTKRDMMPSPVNSVQWKKPVWQPKPITDRIWANAYPQLVPWLGSNRAQDEVVDRAQRRRDRINSSETSTSVAPNQFAVRADYPDVKAEMPFPAVAELLTWSMVKNIVDQDTSPEDLEESFEEVREEQKLIDIWNIGKAEDGGGRGNPRIVDNKGEGRDLRERGAAHAGRTAVVRLLPKEDVAKDERGSFGSHSFIIIDAPPTQIHVGTSSETSNSLASTKRPFLVANRRLRSSPQMKKPVGIPEVPSTAGSAAVVVHFTSLANFKIVRDIVQSALFSSPGCGPWSTMKSGAAAWGVPEVPVTSRPAGPGRFLTVLDITTTKPMTNSIFSPISVYRPARTRLTQTRTRIQVPPRTSPLTIEPQEYFSETGEAVLKVRRSGTQPPALEWCCKVWRDDWRGSWPSRNRAKAGHRRLLRLLLRRQRSLLVLGQETE
ncbi:ssk1 response regulator receiver, partial [Ceratobasidium sp. 414]